MARHSRHVARAARLGRTPGGRASCVLPLRAPPRAPAHLSVRSRRVGGGTRGEGCGGGASGERGGAARAPPPPPPRTLRAGAVAATAGRGRQHGGVSGGVGASQQQRRRWQWPELRVPGGGRRTVRAEAASLRGAGTTGLVAAR